MRNLESRMNDCPICRSIDIKRSRSGFFIKCNSCGFELESCPDCGWRGVDFLKGKNIVKTCYNEECNYKHKESLLHSYRYGRTSWNLSKSMFLNCQFTKTGKITKDSAPVGWNLFKVAEQKTISLDGKLREDYLTDCEWLKAVFFEKSKLDYVDPSIETFLADPVQDWIKYTQQERWELKVGNITRDQLDYRNGKPRYDLSGHEKWQLASGQKSGYELDSHAQNTAWIRYSEHERWEIREGIRDGYTGKLN